MISRLLLLVLFLFPSVSFPAVSVSLDNVRISDLARVVYGDLLNQSYVFDSDFIRAQDDVTVNWRNLSLAQIRALTSEVFTLHGYDLSAESGVLRIRKAKKEDEEILIYSVRFRSARYLSDIVSRVAGVSQLGARGLPGSPGFQSSVEKMPEAVGSASSVVDRSALDQLAYSCVLAECTRIKKLLVQLDQPEPQIVLRAAVYEVGTTAGKGSALQIATSLLGGRLGVGVGNALSAPTGSAHYVDGGLDAVLSVLDNDSRFKIVSRPMLRVRTGSQGKFAVGQSVPVLGAISYDKNGTPVQSVDYKPSGTIFTVRPDVRADVIDLSVTQELSSFVKTTTGVNNSPTLLQRTATSQLSIHSDEVVVFAGLEDHRQDDAGSSLFGLPLSHIANESSSEVLVFIEAQRI